MPRVYVIKRNSFLCGKCQKHFVECHHPESTWKVCWGKGLRIDAFKERCSMTARGGHWTTGPKLVLISSEAASSP